MKKVSWAGCETRMGVHKKLKNSEFWLENLKGGNYFEGLGLDWRIILK
jgi:hypothetical protein